MRCCGAPPLMACHVRAVTGRTGRLPSQDSLAVGGELGMGGGSGALKEDLRQRSMETQLAGYQVRSTRRRREVSGEHVGHARLPLTSQGSCSRAAADASLKKGRVAVVLPRHHWPASSRIDQRRSCLRADGFCLHGRTWAGILRTEEEAIMSVQAAAMAVFLEPVAGASISRIEQVGQMQADTQLNLATRTSWCPGFPT